MPEQSEPISSNRRVAKNAMMMTLRMIIATLVGLYTSRVVFNVLGVEDYGIYGAVGGIVGMMSFLNAAMAGATSRFLTFELGRGDKQRLADTFSSTFIAHCVIAAIVLIAAEIAGVWFLNTKMNIPAERLYAANWVLQFSIVATIIGIIQVPFHATILAHERMSIYAYFEILNVFLKLAIVYMLSCVSIDKLILYTFLLLIVSITMQLIYWYYCRTHFSECLSSKKFNVVLFKPILKYSIANLYGSISITACNQGISIAINLFFGVIYNAALSISQIVHGTILGLTTNICVSFRPQIIKLYAQNCISAMQQSMTNAIKFSVVAYAMIAIPCFFEAPYLLQLWLGSEPIYAVVFLRLLLATSLAYINNYVNNAAIQATGNIKKLSYISGTGYLLIPFIVYVAFKLGADAWWAYFVYGIMVCIIVGYSLIIIHSQIPSFRMSAYLRNYIYTYIIVFISSLFIWLIHRSIDASIERLCVTIVATLAVLSGMTWMFLFTKQEKRLIKQYIEDTYNRVK